MFSFSASASISFGASFSFGFGFGFGGLMGTRGNPDYMLHIRGPGGTIVSAYMPENFVSSVTSDYDTPFADGFVSNERVKLGMRLMGMGTSTQIMSMQVWQGSAPMDFSIPFYFLYDSDVNNDIIRPMRQLMSYTLPTKGPGGLLLSPGPKVRLNENPTPVTVDTAERRPLPGGVGGQAVEQAAELAAQAEALFFSYVDIYDNISLQIGNFMFFPSVVITDVTSDYEIKIDKYSRKPIALNATVGFRTFVTPTVQDLPTILT